MDFIEAARANLLSPPVLFFALGVAAAVMRSDLRFPEPLYVTLTIYLLTAIGFKGGVSMAEAGLASVWLPALAAVALGAAIPLWTYPVLRRLGGFSRVDAAALAAHYGSVSAVTFTVAINFLRVIGQPYEAHAAVFLALMESPAIIVGIVLGKLALRDKPISRGPLRRAVHEAAFGHSVLLLVGSLLIGFLSGKEGLIATEGFFVAPFQGILALFLLELGTVAGRRIGELRKVGLFLLAFGVLMPPVNGLAGLLVGHTVGLSIGGTMLLATLAASASYIAAPAAVRLSLPEANPTLYLTASLAVTFPFNVTVGIPLYYVAAKWMLGSH